MKYEIENKSEAENEKSIISTVVFQTYYVLGGLNLAGLQFVVCCYFLISNK